MRHPGRTFAVFMSLATWFLAAFSVAYAVRVDDPGVAGSPVFSGSTEKPL